MSPFLADLPQAEKHAALKAIVTLCAADIPYEVAERMVCRQLFEDRMLALERMALSMRRVVRG